MIELKHQKPNLKNKRDAALLLQALRDFILTFPVVHGRFFDGLSTDMTRRVLERHCKKEYLVRYTLYGKRNYYYRLGPHAINRWGYPRSRMRALGAQRLPYELGTLAYVHLDPDVVRERLFPEELLERLPWFPNSLMQWAYIWEKNALGTIRVEHRARPANVIAKLQEQVFRYSEQYEFRSLIESGRFFFVVVTATPEQEAALHREAREQAFSVQLTTAHFPDLIHFI